jgi:hypothetical protein
VIQKQEHKNQKQEHEMCKINDSFFYYVNICKHEHEKNITKLWCKIVLKINVEQIEGNEGLYSYLYPFGYVIQQNFQGSFYVCIK